MLTSIFIGLSASFTAHANLNRVLFDQMLYCMAIEGLTKISVHLSIVFGMIVSVNDKRKDISLIVSPRASVHHIS